MPQDYLRLGFSGGSSGAQGGGPVHPVSFPSSGSQGVACAAGTGPRELLASPPPCGSAGCSLLSAPVVDPQRLLIHARSAAALGVREDGGRQVKGRRRCSRPTAFTTPQPLLTRVCMRERAQECTCAQGQWCASSRIQPVHPAPCKSFSLSF